MKAIAMPRHCDDQFMVLFWSADEFLPAFAIFAMGMLINQKIICAAIALVAAKMFRRLKEGNPDGYLLHMAYWIGLVSLKKSRTMRNAFIREYIV